MYKTPKHWWAWMLMALLLMFGIAAANHPDNQKDDNVLVGEPTVQVHHSTLYEDGSMVLAVKIRGARVSMLRVSGCFAPKLGCSVKPLKVYHTRR